MQIKKAAQNVKQIESDRELVEQQHIDTRRLLNFIGYFLFVLDCLFKNSFFCLGFDGCADLWVF
jgi:hypothetical protein